MQAGTGNQQRGADQSERVLRAAVPGDTRTGAASKGRVQQGNTGTP